MVGGRDLGVGGSLRPVGRRAGERPARDGEGEGLRDASLWRVMGVVGVVGDLRQALPSGSLVNCPGWGGSGGQREVRGPGGGGPGPSPHPGLGGHGIHSWNCSSSPRVQGVKSGHKKRTNTQTKNIKSLYLRVVAEEPSLELKHTTPSPKQSHGTQH